jgi:hypothetical protein
MTMKGELRRAFKTEMGLAHNLIADQDFEGAWYHLERAHILGQRGLWSHIVVHMTMLNFAIRRSDVREVLGQIMRILATIPGYLFGWIPVGNTGGSNVVIIFGAVLACAWFFLLWSVWCFWPGCLWLRVIARASRKLIKSGKRGNKSKSQNLERPNRSRLCRSSIGMPSRRN